jgi:hypothetical protein
MADETTIIYFSDGTNEIIVAPLRRIEQLITKMGEGFVPLTTVDGRRINVNRACVTRFCQPPQDADDQPGSAPDGLQVTGVRDAALNLARSIRLAISARQRSSAF